MKRQSWSDRIRKLIANSSAKTTRRSQRKSRVKSFVPCCVTVMEPRQVLSGVTAAAKAFGAQTNEFVTSGFSSSPSSDPPVEIAKRALAAQASSFGLQKTDVTSFRVMSTADSKKSGLTHVYLRQQLNGIDVDGGDANVSITKDGRVLSMGSRLIPNLAARATSVKNLGAAQAVQSAAAFVGIQSPTVGAVQQSVGGTSEGLVFAGGNVSKSEVPTKLVYRLGDDGRLHLAWNLNLQVPGSDDWFDMNVDTETGAILSQFNWTHYSDIPDKVAAAAGNAVTGTSANQTGGQSQQPTSNFTGVPNSGLFNVLPYPGVDAPNVNGRFFVGNPADALASPFGWNDTNGVAGADSTLTTGNNVSAQEDTDDNDTGGFQPDGGSGLNFNFGMDLNQAPSTYQSAAITQLYYTNNVLHDVHYQYGFDEASGNFQVNNYGRGGIGGDAVQADAQDGSGLNNANFGTPPDGFQPRMQQFIFNLTTPNRDSSLDNGIIAHEYGHGVSNRLTGGAANVNALDALQSGGMGEGWGDYWALMFAQNYPSLTASYGVGTYVLGQASDGAGIRRYKYSYDTTINPLNFFDYYLSSEVHDAGEIWASALWDMTCLLVQNHGFSYDLYSGNGGNNLAMQLVMDGLKLQPANPTFLDGRDAILAADRALTGGQNQTTIWAAFARRGMGVNAYDGGDADATLVFSDFNVPNLSELSGVVYDDVNGNGVQNPGEAGRSNWQVYLDANNNGVLDVSLPATTRTYTSTNVPVNIVDNGRVYSNLTINDPGQVQDINVTLNLNHTWDEDLDIFLISPTFKRIELTTDNGGSSDNYLNTTFDDEAANSITTGAAPFTGTFRPEGLLSGMDGESLAGTWYLEIIDDVAADTGILNSWSIDVSSSPIRHVSTNVPVALPVPVAQVTSTINVAGSGGITDVNVWFDISHTWDEDLDVYLISPSGTRVELTTDNGGSSDNYMPYVDDEGPVSIIAGAAPFNYWFRPEGLLSAFDGENAGGTWTLEINDDFPGIDGGTLNAWGIDVETGEESTLTDANGLYSFKGLPAGNYQIRDVLQPTFERTVPGTGLHSASLAVNQVRNNLDFGNRLINTPSVIGAFGPNVTYVENAAALILDPDATVSDPNTSNFNGGSLTVDLTVNGESGDRLGINNQGTGAGQIGVNGTFVTFGGTTIGSFTGGTGVTPLVVSLNANATPVAVEALLRNVTFRSVSEAPSTLPRTVRVRLTDATNLDSNLPTKTINVTAVNDAPVLSGIEATNAGYTENHAGVNVSPGILVTDADHANLASATVTISGNYANGQDELLFTNANGITGSWNPATGVLTLTGSSSVANYQTALRTVKYRNTSNSPSNLVRTIQFSVNDGTTGSNVVSRNLNVTPVNDQPIQSGLVITPLVFTEGSVPISVQPNVTITDLDHPNLTSARIKISDNFQSGSDVLTFTPIGNITGIFTAISQTLVLSGVDTVANYQTALRSVKFQNTHDNPNPASRQILMLVNDGVINSPVAFRAVNIVPVNDAPVLSGIEAAPLAYTGTAVASITSSITLADPDNTKMTFARIKISAGYVNGQDSLSFVNTPTISGAFDAASGTLVLSGTDTIANYVTALRNVKFRNTSTPRSASSRTIQFLVSDGTDLSNIVSRNISVAALP